MKRIWWRLALLLSALGLFGLGGCGSPNGSGLNVNLTSPASVSQRIYFEQTALKGFVDTINAVEAAHPLPQNTLNDIYAAVAIANKSLQAAEAAYNANPNDPALPTDMAELTTAVSGVETLMQTNGITPPPTATMPSAPNTAPAPATQGASP